MINIFNWLKPKNNKPNYRKVNTLIKLERKTKSYYGLGGIKIEKLNLVHSKEVITNTDLLAKFTREEIQYLNDNATYYDVDNECIIHMQSIRQLLNLGWTMTNKEELPSK